MIAPGAEEIIKARRKGYRPADTVVVSLVGPVGLTNPVVYPAMSHQYDWRWVKDLDVALFIRRDIEWRDVAFALRLAEPKNLCLWDVDSQKGAEVLWRPVKQGSIPGAQMIVHCGWLWAMNFSQFHEEDNKVFFQ